MPEELDEVVMDGTITFLLIFVKSKLVKSMPKRQCQICSISQQGIVFVREYNLSNDQNLYLYVIAKEGDVIRLPQVFKFSQILNYTIMQFSTRIR